MTPSTPFPTLIDSSMMAAWKSCQTLGKLVYFEHWKTKEPSVHLRAGAAFAKGIEAARTSFFIHNLSSEDSVANGLSALINEYGDFQCPADSPKSCERTAGALEFYFDNYPLTKEDSVPITLPGGKLAIEFSFAEPLDVVHPVSGDPLIYVGRADAIINYAGSVLICDEKTASQLGASWGRQWDLRSQFTGYCWGTGRAGIKVDGVLVRGVSILKTKYDTQQAISYRPEWQVDRWYNELCDTLKEMKEAWRLGKFRHNLDHACAEYGGCQFRQVCATQDEQPWLETYFERREWNPLLRTETKL